MSLVNCPECGREKVSDSAVSCPDCGFAIKDYYIMLKEEQERIKAEKERIKKEQQREIEKIESEKKRQSDTIWSLNRQIENASEEIKKSCIGLVISLVVFIVCVKIGGLGLLVLISSVVILYHGINIYLFLKEKDTAEYDLSVAKRSLNEYDAIYEQRAKEWAAQAKALSAQNELKHPKCPMCGSRNTERITTIDRTISIAAAGLASSKIGKQYQCKKCKHKW